MRRTRPHLLAPALTLLLALTAAAQERPAPPGPGGPLERAQAAFAAGRYAEALEESRRAADASPTSARALLARAGMAEFMGEFDEARTFYGRAGALTPDDPLVIYRTASFALRVGEADRALGLLDRLLDLHPRQVRWLFRWGPTRLQSRLLRDHPSLEHIVQIKIDILTEKGELDQARKLARGYAIVRTDHDYCGEARQTSASNAGEDAIYRAFRLATLAQADAADCIWWYGQWLTDHGYVRLGRLMVMEGTRVTPSAGNKESGARYVRIRLGGDVPKRAEQLFLIARQRYVRDGDIDGATRLFDETIRLAPAFARPYNYRAFIAWDQGDQEGAIAWLRRAVQADGDSWRTRRNLGRFLERLERYPEAEEHLRKAVALFGDDAGGRLALARVLYAQGKYAEYEKETRGAVDFFANWREQVPEVRAFFGKFERWGPGASLPPAPDPPIIIGWNYD